MFWCSNNDSVSDCINLHDLLNSFNENEDYITIENNSSMTFDISNLEDDGFKVMKAAISFGDGIRKVYSAPIKRNVSSLINTQQTEWRVITHNFSFSKRYEYADDIQVKNLPKIEILLFYPTGKIESVNIPFRVSYKSLLEMNSQYDVLSANLTNQNTNSFVLQKVSDESKLIVSSKDWRKIYSDDKEREIISNPFERVNNRRGFYYNDDENVWNYKTIPNIGEDNLSYDGNVISFSIKELNVIPSKITIFYNNVATGGDFYSSAWIGSQISGETLSFIPSSGGVPSDKGVIEYYFVVEGENDITSTSEKKYFNYNDYESEDEISCTASYLSINNHHYGIRFSADIPDSIKNFLIDNSLKVEVVNQRDGVEIGDEIPFFFVDDSNTDVEIFYKYKFEGNTRYKISYKLKGIVSHETHIDKGVERNAYNQNNTLSVSVLNDGPCESFSININAALDTPDRFIAYLYHEDSEQPFLFSRTTESNQQTMTFDGLLLPDGQYSILVEGPMLSESSRYAGETAKGHLDELLDFSFTLDEKSVIGYGDYATFNLINGQRGIRYKRRVFVKQSNQKTKSYTLSGTLFDEDFFSTDLVEGPVDIDMRYEEGDDTWTVNVIEYAKNDLYNREITSIVDEDVSFSNADFRFVDDDIQKRLSDENFDLDPLISKASGVLYDENNKAYSLQEIRDASVHKLPCSQMGSSLVSERQQTIFVSKNGAQTILKTFKDSNEKFYKRYFIYPEKYELSNVVDLEDSSINSVNLLSKNIEYISPESTAAKSIQLKLNENIDIDDEYIAELHLNVENTITNEIIFDKNVFDDDFQTYCDINPSIDGNYVATASYKSMSYKGGTIKSSLTVVVLNGNIIEDESNSTE